MGSPSLAGELERPRVAPTLDAEPRAGAAAAPSSWIQSPAWDATWMFAGLWAPALAVLGFLLYRALSGTPVSADAPGYDITAIALIYLPLSVLHRITTTYSVLGTSILAEDRRRNPRRYLHVPAAIVAGCVLLSLALAFHADITLLPGNPLWPFFVLAWAMILWERWHFCAQEFGVLSIYRIRAGQSAPEDKRFDRLYTLVLMLGANMVLYVCMGFEDERLVLLHGTPLANQERVFEQLALGAYLVGIAALVTALVREWRHPRRSLPKLWFYLLVGGHTLLLYHFPYALGLFFLSYVFHHWMVSVGLFSRVTARHFEAEPDGRGVRKMVLRVAPLLLVTVLFYVFFEPLDRAGTLVPVPNEMIFTGATGAAKLLAGFVIGLFFSLNFLHYYYDRCFYAFSQPAVRKAVAPLLFGPPRGAESSSPHATSQASNNTTGP